MQALLSRWTVLLYLGLCTALAARADYPERPIRVVMPWAAGTALDAQLRDLTPALGTHLGGSLYVDNKPGAGSLLGTLVAAGAPADGYTLLAGSQTSFAHKYIQGAARHDPLRDFVPVAPTFTTANVLVVPAAHPARDVRALIAWVRERAGAANYGSGGVGSPSHLLTAAFAARNGLQATHVPLKNLQADLVPMMASGDIHFAFPAVGLVTPSVRQGSLRVLAVTSARRLEEWPQVPTLAEALGDDAYVVEAWQGLWAPAGTPEAIVRQLNAATRQALAAPGLAERAHQRNHRIAAPMSSAEFIRFMRAEDDKWRRIVEDAGAMP